MDFFTPIVTINETPEGESSNLLKTKKVKIKIEIEEEEEEKEKEKEKDEVPKEVVKKRGRPKKNVDQKKTESITEKAKESCEEDDPTWVSSGYKKKRKPRKTNKEPKKPKKVKEIPPEVTQQKVEIKSEPMDGLVEGVEIKKEIKEEPIDPDMQTAISLSEEDLKSMIPSEDTRTFKCPLCSKEKQDNTERTPVELKLHYKDSHPGKRLRQSRFSLEVYPCDICGKQFKTSGAVKEHMETHSNYFYCEVCNSSQKKILDHIIHLRIHSEVGIFQCLMCDFKTPEINKITEHVNNHEDVLKYWCESCKKGFQILPWFQEHDNFHTGLKPFDCEFCGKCFLYSRFLHAHKVNMHKEDMNCPSLHECVLCKKQYQHKNSLKLHMNSHTGNFSICDICGKMLSSKEKLKFHIRTHTGFKPYSCTYCEKSFTKKPILVEHVRIHTGERPYVCEYCTKAFSQRSSLVIHIRGHTGERPYVCQFCTKGFVAKAMLNIHLKSCKGLLIPADI